MEHASVIRGAEPPRHEHDAAHMHRGNANVGKDCENAERGAIRGIT